MKDFLKKIPITEKAGIAPANFVRLFKHDSNMSSHVCELNKKRFYVRMLRHEAMLTLPTIQAALLFR